MALPYTVTRVERGEVKDFIEKHHYSHSVNGLMGSYWFSLTENESGRLIGAMVYGKLGMANAWKKYGDRIEDVLELRRLVLVDDTLRNAESFFIGKTLKWLRKNSDVKVVVSYADPNYGHSGIVYRASNFTHVGMTAPGKVIWHNGKKYHDKAIRTKYKGELKPFAKRLVEALDSGEAYYETQKPKHIYLYKLKSE